MEIAATTFGQEVSCSADDGEIGTCDSSGYIE